MEIFVLLFACILLRLTVIPMRTALHIGIHCGSGLLCLWLLNGVSSFTGILFPLNAATVVLAGFGGLPGIALMTLLAITA